MDNKEVKPIPGGPVLKEALQGATLGFGEEALAGLRSMIPGQPSYPEAVKAEREELRKFESESPGGATTAQLGGALLPAVATMGMAEVPAALEVGGNLALTALKKYAPDFAARLPGFLKSTITGVETGMKAGAGGAEKTEDIPAEMAKGGVVGGVLGGVGRIAVDTAAPAFRNLFGNPDKIAARKIANALEADKTTPEELAAKMKSAAKGADVTLADVAGENLRGLMRVATNVPGEARQEATKFLNQRQLDQFNRISNDVEQTMIGKKGVDVAKLKRDLDTVRKQASAPFYDAANKVKIPNTEELAILIKAMPNNVLAEGREALKIERLPIPKLPQTINELVEIPVRDKAGKVTYLQMKPESNDFRIYDLLKKGLDQVIDKQQDKLSGKFTPKGALLLDLKKDYLDYLDKVNPDYKKARELWAGPTRADRMLDKGRRVFSADPSNIAYEISKLSPTDKQYFQLGAAQAVKEALAGKRDMLDKATAIFSTPKARELLRPIFPSKAAYDVFANRMETEQAMSRTRGYMLPTAGSKTAGLGVDIGEFGGEAESGALSKLIRGDFGGAALQLAPGVYGKTTGMTPPVASSLQKTLLTPGVTAKSFADQVKAARQAAARGERQREAITKGLTVPYAIPGATEQNR